MMMKESKIFYLNERMEDFIFAYTELDSSLREELPFFLFLKNQYGEYYVDCYKLKEPAMSFEEYIGGITQLEFLNSGVV